MSPPPPLPRALDLYGIYIGNWKKDSVSEPSSQNLFPYHQN